ncbi:MAG: MATE family efflux transporter [Lachnospiraceae bacterium]|nr:MATE family efflux transporter [Lachnospiraceae bacterium]
MKELAKNKQFWTTLLTLVIPITIQNFFSQAVNSVDILMLGYVGQNELSAVSLANQFAFLMFGLLFGLNSGITILAAQYWGKGDTDSIQIVTGIAMKIITAITLVIFVGCMIIPDYLMKIYTADPVLTELGSGYLRIAAWSYIFWGMSNSYESMLRSVERAVTSTVITSSALLLNVVLNAVFIFGLLGSPKLGIIGVALATTISRIVEFLLCATDAARGKLFKMQPKLLLAHNKVLFGDFLKYAMPALVNDCSWTVAFSTYSIIMGHLSSDMVAANSVATTVRDLFTVVAFALGSGAAVMVGIEIGKNNFEKAKDEGDLFCWISLGVGAVIGLIIFFSRPFVIGFFNLSDTAAGYLNIMLIISSYYVVGQIMNTLVIAGLLRAGGNTRWGMICDIIDMWLVSVPLGFFCAFVLKLPPMWVYFILCLDEFWKIPFVYSYYKSYRWIRNITR